MVARSYYAEPRIPQEAPFAQTIFTSGLLNNLALGTGGMEVHAAWAGAMVL